MSTRMPGSDSKNIGSEHALFCIIHTLFLSLAHSLTHTHISQSPSPTHTLTPSLTFLSPSLTHSPTHTHTHTHTHSFPHLSLTLTHSFTYSHSLTHSLTHAHLTHPLTSSLACCHRCFGESLSTLNFAKRAKMIKNKAVVNEDTSGTVQQLQSEIKRLKLLVDKLRSEYNTPTCACTNVHVHVP